MRSSVTLIALLAGCSAPPFVLVDNFDASSTADAADAAVLDSGDDAEPSRCDELLPQSFSCTKVAARAVSTACSDADIDAYLSRCSWPAYDAAGCAAFRSEHAACFDCVKRFAGGSPALADAAACMRIVAPESDCGHRLACARDCAGRSASSASAGRWATPRRSVTSARAAR